MGYFDLSNDANSIATRESAAPMPVWEQVLMFAVVVIGVILSAGVAQARAGEPITLNLNWPWVLIASFIALLVFPSVWKSVGARADSPLLVRMGLAAQGGAFWAVLMTAAEKATG